MKEVDLNNFDSFLKAFNEFKDNSKGDKVKNRRKERAQMITFLIAIVSFFLTIYTIIEGYYAKKYSIEYDQKVQAYSFWFDYLKLASDHPNFANGLKYIDTFSIEELACREQNNVKYPDSTIDKFVDYAWFVANALGTCEIVSELRKNDNGWTATIDTIISNHISYVRNNCFEKEHYNEWMRNEINKISERIKK